MHPLCLVLDNHITAGTPLHPACTAPAAAGYVGDSFANCGRHDTCMGQGRASLKAEGPPATTIYLTAVTPRAFRAAIAPVRSFPVAALLLQLRPVTMPAPGTGRASRTKRIDSSSGQPHFLA